MKGSKVNSRVQVLFMHTMPAAPQEDFSSGRYTLGDTRKKCKLWRLCISVL